MTDREKLIELIGQVQYLGGLELALADHLIANGVTVLERTEWEYVGKNIHGQNLTRCKHCGANAIEGGLFCRTCGATMKERIDSE